MNLLIGAFSEAQPSPSYMDFANSRSRYIPTSDNVTVSPLRWPQPGHPLAGWSNKCSPSTYRILCDIGELTNILFSQDENSNPTDIFARHNTTGHSELDRLHELATSAIQRIHARLAALPSAAGPGTAVTNDWVYECCRLAALISSTAIFHRISFSAAARGPYLPASATATAIPLTRSLSAALAQTDFSDGWGDMAGCLLWVALVGGAAANGLTQLQADAQARRTFVVVVMSAVNMLAKDNTTDQKCVVMQTLLSMLRVQKILGAAAHAYS